MSHLIESIKLLDGKFLNIDLHEKRMARALSVLFGAEGPVNLEKYLYESEFPSRGLFKCRISYNAASREKAITPYTARAVNNVKVVKDDHISYPFKLADRSGIDRLFDRRGDCDDVMIVRQERVTDCSYSNIVFRKGRNWFTPDSPLLQGVMRTRLILENKVRVGEILLSDVRSFDSFKIINAMLEFESPEIDVSDIVF
jgi:4-amino-4-deoxychorismate lyase